MTHHKGGAECAARGGIRCSGHILRGKQLQYSPLMPSVGNVFAKPTCFASIMASVLMTHHKSYNKVSNISISFPRDICWTERIVFDLMRELTGMAAFGDHDI